MAVNTFQYHNGAVHIATFLNKILQKLHIRSLVKKSKTKLYNRECWVLFNTIVHKHEHNKLEQILLVPI